MKIGKATVPRTGHLHLRRAHASSCAARDLSQRPDRQDLASSTTSSCCSPAAGRRAAQRAVLNATLVAIAEHGLVPSVQAARMTLRRRARRAAGRGGGRHPGLRLGDPRRVGDRRPPVQRDRRARRSDGSVARRRRAGGDAAPGAPPASRSPATATRCTRSATRASARCSTSRARPAPTCASSRSPRRSRQLMPEVLGKDAASSTSRARFPRCCSAPAFRSAALKGVPILARTAGLIAHLYEEMQQPIGFALSYQADARDGVRRRSAGGFGSR